MFAVSQQYLDAMEKHWQECRASGDWEAPITVYRDLATGEVRVITHPNPNPRRVKKATGDA